MCMAQFSLGISLFYNILAALQTELAVITGTLAVRVDIVRPGAATRLQHTIICCVVACTLSTRTVGGVCSLHNAHIGGAA